MLEEKYQFSTDIIKLFIDQYGTRARDILDALSRPSSFFFIRVNTLKIQPQDLVEMLKREGFKPKMHPHFPDAICLPVQGPFQMENRGKEVRVDKFAAESVFTGSDLYGPGIIGVEKIRKGEIVRIVDPRGKTVGMGIAQRDSKELLKQKEGVAVKILESPYRVPDMRTSPLFENGFWFNQSLPAMVVSRVLDPQPDELIVDLCAAPGGKTTHVAQLMKNRGQIIAIDRSPHRIEKLKQHVKRLGIENVEIIQTRKIKKFLEERNLEKKADRVIVDPPCSALGVRPKLFDETTCKDVENHSNYQKFFLHLAAKIVKPGGFIVYSTCTLTREENELNVQYVKNKFGWRVEKQSPLLGNIGEIGEEKENLQRFYPDVHDTTGYFIALFSAPN
ncbi:MAG: PUA domain-containing protein [Candidatus Helarchaeales archaeon]